MSWLIHHEHFHSNRGICRDFEIAENHAYSQKLLGLKVRIEVSPGTISRSGQWSNCRPGHCLLIVQRWTFTTDTDFKKLGCWSAWLKEGVHQQNKNFFKLRHCIRIQKLTFIFLNFNSVFSYPGTIGNYTFTQWQVLLHPGQYPRKYWFGCEIMGPHMWNN